MASIEEKLQQGKIKTTEGIKKHIFDWVAAIIIVALIAASLNVFGLIDFKTINFVEFLISWFPYFAAAILLHTDLYKKGIFVGKETDKFSEAIRDYSKIANALTGEQIKGLHLFCEDYNRDVAETLQKRILRNEGIVFDDFEYGLLDKNIKPLKILDKQELLANGYNKRQIEAIQAAKKVTVKGINVNILLSSTDADDTTYIGDDEKVLQKKQIISSTIKYMVTTLLLSVIAIKNVGDWGWVGLILTLFKVAYLFAGCCMSYFKGYDDATIGLVNHFTRKADILKMYLKYIPENVTDEEPNSVEVDDD
jgi:hypothetical protein